MRLNMQQTHIDDGESPCWDGQLNLGRHWYRIMGCPDTLSRELILREDGSYCVVLSPIENEVEA